MKQATKLIAPISILTFLFVSCNQAPAFKTGAGIVFSPTADISAECPVLRLQIQSLGITAYDQKFSTENDGKNYTNGYAQFGYIVPFSTSPLSPKTTLQCLNNGQVVGESIREGRPANDSATSLYMIHISASKTNQSYVGTYVSRTGIAPVIEIGPEITAIYK